MILDRRTVLQLIGTASALLALPPTARAAPALGTPEAFSPELVEEMARTLSRSAYRPAKRVPKAWLDLNYDKYRDIRFATDRAVWRDMDRPFEMQLFSPGFYFDTGVRIDLVDGDTASPLLFDPKLFNFGPLVPDLPLPEDLGFSGFRIHGAINTDTFKDEFLVFQGASYFRGVGKGQAYGLSARGLALKTADPRGEEFPSFRRFWVETPTADATTVTIHALLDSPSTTGAYHFVVRPGPNTEMDCSSVLFPRVPLDHVGIAPLTSMFLFDEKLKKRFDDFRPAVHDSDGIAIHNGNGERLWRPITNPRTLQVSNFLDSNPKGFGLVQRSRDFSAFNDLEAHYEKRPDLWVEPRGDWGRGAVSLVEIPTEEEINDNIVAYWRPSEPLLPDQEYRFEYGLAWGIAPTDPARARVTGSAFGLHPREGRLAVIEFDQGDGTLPEVDALKPDIHVMGGDLLGTVLQRNTVTGGLRLAFSFSVGETEIAELRAQIRHDGKPVSEVWLYRWTAP